nr:Uncharacterised protein [Klebsiella pneumoniae]
MTPSLSRVWGIPLIAIGRVIFTFGVSIIFSTLNLFFRDRSALSVWGLC